MFTLQSDFTNHGNLSSIATTFGAGRPGTDSCQRQEKDIFFFAATSRSAMDPTQFPTKWIPGALSLGTRIPGCEIDRSLKSSSQVLMASCLIKHRIRFNGAVLSYAQGNCYFLP
jgi:hypothetical protein